MSDSDYIDLKRRFRNLQDSEFAHGEFDDPGVLEYLEELGMGSVVGWCELLEKERVVLLAEAGAGKSREMEEQARRLNRDQKFAFFVPLEYLEKKPLVSCLDELGGQRLEGWKFSGDPGWFFLDSVDELKLNRGTLDWALLRFSRDISGHLDRARVVISCRPSDWRPSLDQATIWKRIPVPDKTSKVAAPDPEEVFMEAFRRSGNENLHFNEEDSEKGASNKICTVAMLSMNNRQIMEFASFRNIRDADAFLQAIARENAWDFARRPLDLHDLVRNWITLGRLGTRLEQIETNVTAKLRDDPDRPDSGVLSDKSVREGAETLALGFALTRKRTIGSPERSTAPDSTEGLLHAEEILPNWTVEQRQSLLRRALFDPETLGRIRFHHRSVEEYLAAHRLRGLRDRGMSKRELIRMLFSEVQGVETVRPSMHAIISWLALWDVDVRRELIRLEPEILLSFGDPSNLELESRADLLRKISDNYGRGGWRGLEISLDFVRRLAHPELADVIRECWRTNVSNVEICELLIDVIGQARIKGCADLALDTALDAAGDPRCRMAGVKALIECNMHEMLEQCASSMLTDSASWPNEVVFPLADDLFPKFITAEQLVMLIECRHGGEEDSLDIGWVLNQIGKTIDLNSEPAIALRKELMDLIFRMRDRDSEPYSVRSKFSCLAPALATLCERQISASAEEPEPGLLDACVIASRFGEGEIDTDKSLGRLRGRFETGTKIRNAAFWSEQSFLEKLMAAGEGNHPVYQAHNSIVGLLEEADRPWLEAFLRDQNRRERKLIALDQLIGLWYRRGESDSELDELRELVRDDADLLQSLPNKTTPTSKYQNTQRQIDELERQRQSRQNDLDAHEKERIREWNEWRKWLMEKPDEAFSAENIDATLSSIHLWLREYKQNSFRFNNWDRERIQQAFGTEVAERTEVGFQAFWRERPPILWSERGVSRGNSIPQGWILGLLGVSSEASSPGWEKRLTADDARTAAAYATIELNGFAPFLTDLAESHPCEVEVVIGGEVSAELSVGGEYESLPAIQNLCYPDKNDADKKLKQLIVPRLIEGLEFVPHELSTDNETRWPHHLERLLRILAVAENDSDRKQIAHECLQRYEADSDGSLAAIWLRGLFQFDPLRGTKALICTLGDSGDPIDRARAVKMFAALFGGLDPVQPMVEDQTECARMFGKLVRSAYAFVRREEDNVHNEGYTPDLWRDAEMARNFLLSRLLQTPGPKANQILLELADEEDFAHFPDRLRMLVRRKAAAEGDTSSFVPEDIAALETKLEAPARDAEGLFSIMMGRLADVADDLRHHDFSDRITVQGITEESQMRRTLAIRLEAKANGIYKVTQEEEVVDQKRTDIRLLSTTSAHKAVIEIKIADKNRSLKDLERALEDQLVEKYLRHESCKRGCLLLTYAGTREYWRHPENRKRLSVADGVEFLREKVKEIEQSSSSDVRLAVFLLDLREN